MKKITLILISIIISSCQNNQKDKFDEGIYCLKSYLDKDNFENRYIDYFLVKVTKDKIIYYGTVNTWGHISNRNFESEKKSKINDSIILQTTQIGFGPDSFTTQKFIKLKNCDKIVDGNGINREEFVKYLNRSLITGNYKFENRNIEFTEDGKIKKSDSLKTFSVNPRFGTCWWYDYRTIEINKEIWKFEFTKKNLILTKYLKRNEEELGKLSNIKIVLNR
ncbi:MAG TPA: hypothetical protein VF465_21580 [Flavobacterium sp.]|uniref:hypothetical protein n=1 Tax=Flavobacterium sp. TaxID=239 RepID=UPI002ED34787